MQSHCVHLCDSMMYAIVFDTYMIIIWYLCIGYIMNSLLYTWYLHICVCHTIPSVSSIECCVLLVVTSDIRQRSPAAALRQQQKLCGCPCFQRPKYWLHAKGFPLTTTVVRPHPHKVTTSTSSTLTSSSTTATILMFLKLHWLGLVSKSDAFIGGHCNTIPHSVRIRRFLRSPRQLPQVALHESLV